MVFDDWKKPSEEVVKHFTNVFEIANHRSEMELKRLFDQEPTEENIGKRVNRLSAIYGTRISLPDQKLIASFIYKEGIFEDAVAGKDGVVEKIAVNENYGYNHCLSFASKFCSFCNPEVYPIYDSVVLEVLRRLNSDYHFDAAYDKAEMKRIRNNLSYARFCKLIDNFRNHVDFHLENCKLREIDKYLWTSGKGLVD